MDRWHKVEELFNAALAEPPDRRARFVNEACTDDDELRREVLALIDRAWSDDSFLEDSPMAMAEARPASLRPGQMVGSFEVLELIGAGGMGEVYRARDLKLRREVAIKVLPEAFLGHADRLTRFEREARAASALNHPGICTIYGFENHAGRPVIVMELIAGDTLASRLRKGPLPLDKALDVAIQLSDALDAAHTRTIVHRDLKPANVMLTRSGIKVLDFGLAKLEEGPAGETLNDLTEQGTIMGTLLYMSPEQVQGIESDARSDIFSFGLLLYEAVTGKQAFQAGNRAGLIGAILHTDPPPARTLHRLSRSPWSA